MMLYHMNFINFTSSHIVEVHSTKCWSENVIKDKKFRQLAVFRMQSKPNIKT